MHKDSAPKRISITELITPGSNWKQYSHFHDEFLEELSYENQKSFSCDIWQLNYI